LPDDATSLAAWLTTAREVLPRLVQDAS
jgi:hypothetical protein